MFVLMVINNHGDYWFSLFGFQYPCDIKILVIFFILNNDVELNVDELFRKVN